MKTQKATDMICEMEASLDKIASDAIIVDSAYLNAKGRNYISFSDDSIGFADQISLLPSLLCSMLILLVAFACVFLRKVLSDKEEEL